MNKVTLSDLDELSDFDRAAAVLKRLGWHYSRVVNGPDARVIVFVKNQTEIFLVYDDILGTFLKGTLETTILQTIASDIMKELGQEGN